MESKQSAIVANLLHDTTCELHAWFSSLIKSSTAAVENYEEHIYQIAEFQLQEIGGLELCRTCLFLKFWFSLC
jgi:hypothetical protein